MNNLSLLNPADKHSQEALARLLLLLLLFTDLAFILLHFLSRMTPVFDNPLLSLEKDQGYSEFFQYQKEFWIIILLIVVSIKSRLVGYTVWALLFVYLLCDDAFQFHEKYGRFLVNEFDLPALFGLRAQDLGELLISGTVGLFFLTLLLGFYVSSSAAFKRSTKHLALLIIALAFFGVFVDMLHIALKMGWRVNFVLGVLEDGGELIVMSFIVWYVFLLKIYCGRIDLSFWELISNKLFISHRNITLSKNGIVYNRPRSSNHENP